MTIILVKDRFEDNAIKMRNEIISSTGPNGSKNLKGKHLADIYLSRTPAA